MTKDILHQLIKECINEVITEGSTWKPGQSVWAPGTGGGTKHKKYGGLIGNIPHRAMQGTPEKRRKRVSTEYTLTPEEEKMFRNMSLSKRRSYLNKKLYYLRKSRGKCVVCPKGEVDAEPGSIFCKKHQAEKLEIMSKFRKDKNEKGLCSYGTCEEPFATGVDNRGRKHSFCKTHLDLHNSSALYRKQMNRAAKIGWDIE